MAQAARPLSPHLQIYRWYFSMALSIVHRATGIALTLALPLFVWWLVALGGGPGAYADVEWAMTSILGRIIMVGLTFVIMLHTALGVRHLVWDAGYGYDKRVAFHSGRVAVGAAAALTILVWIAYIIAR